MELSEFLPIINDSMRIYINKRGFITTDKIHHENIFKFTLIHYWDRFSKCVEQDFLWSAIRNISSADCFEFHLNGKPHNAPATIDYIIRKERERHIILNLTNRRTILPNSLVFIACAAIVTLIMVKGGGYEILRLNLHGLYNSLVIRPTQFARQASETSESLELL